MFNAGGCSSCHAVPNQPDFSGYIGEGTVAIVLIEMIGWFPIRWKAFGRGAVHHEDIEPAIMVKVKECDSAAGSL